MKLALSTFILGLILGGLAVHFRPNEPEAEEEAHKQTPLSTRTLKDHREPTSSSINVAEWQGIESSDLENKLTTLSLAESIDVISALLEVTDPYKGLIYTDQKTIKEILNKMAKIDFKSSVEMIESAFPDATRNNLIKELILKHAIQEFSAAITFADHYLDEKSREEIVSKLFQMGIKKGHEEAIQALAMVPISGPGGNRFGSSETFPKDFDFQIFGEAAYQLASLGKDKGTFVTFPSNFLEEWSKRAPDDAMSFYNERLSDQSRGFFPFNDLGNLAEGYLSSVDPSQGVDWLEASLGTNDLSSHDRKELLSAVRSTPENRNAIINDLISRQASPEDKASIAASFFGSVQGHRSPATTEFRHEVLKAFPDPESRINYLVSKARENRSNSSEVVKSLQNLGHNEEDISRFLNASQK